jgi:uncharacterized protein (TIGR03382 family)
MVLSTVALLTAVSDYGDVREDGVPGADDRAIVLWTNAARVAPLAFTGDYAAGDCSTDEFEDDEKVAKPPLYIDLMLTDAAIFHSEDMRENDCFQHESCDGTDTFERINSFYTDTVGAEGENIAQGYPDARNAVLSGWMCSHEGHRANIMSADYNEIGAGVSADYYTQDFAYGELKEGAPPVRMAIEDDVTRVFDSGDELEDGWYADWGDVAAPAGLAVIQDGIETPMALLVGAPEQGLYAVDGAAEGSGDCHEWYVWWKTAAGAEGTFPGSGSFLRGTCDAEIDFIADQRPRNGLFGEVDPENLADAMVGDLSLVGCNAAGAAAGLPALLASLVISLRRRGRSAA